MVTAKWAYNPSTCKPKKIHPVISPPANPPASLPPNISPQLACIEMDSTFYDVLKLKTAIKKVFLSTLVCSLFWNTFLFQLRATPPPPEYTYIYCSSMKYVLLRIQVFTYRHTCFIYFESYTINSISVFVFVFFFTPSYNTLVVQ